VFPSEEEILKYIEKKELVNFSMIAKAFKLRNSTVADLMEALKAKKKVTIKKFGGSKMVILK
jgi:Mn-dependent DtxR family transcriptional regulator